MDAADFTANLKTSRVARRVTYFDVTDSTNTRAALAAAAGEAADGDVFIAGSQTAGRGTDGRAWISAAPVGLWMSMVFLEPLRARPLSLLPAVALATVLRRDHGLLAHLKWPNDVLVGAGDDTRKLAGILTESCAVGDARAASGGVTSGRAWVVGVGVNVKQDSFAAGPLAGIATSMRIETGRDVALPELFGSFVAEMERLDDPSVPLPAMWTELSRMPGRTISLTRAGVRATVRVTGVDDHGHLRIVHPDGRADTLAGVTGIDIDMRY